MAKGKKKKTPSRLKYEETHPTMSFRATKEVEDRLRVVQKAENKSVMDIFKIGLGLLEVKIRSEAEIREKAFREGHRKGYELAESIYKVTFPCSVCRETIPVEDKVTKEAVKKYLVQDGWGHADCINRRY